MELNSDKPDAEALRMEAELRATLRPGGSAGRVWHLIDFDIEREKRMAERHIDLEETLNRGWRWVWLGPLQLSMSIAALVMAIFLLHEFRSATEPRQPASWVAGDHDRDTLSVAEKTKLEALLNDLSSGEPNVCDKAAQEIAAFGPRALPALEQISRMQAPELHCRIQKLIAQLSAAPAPSNVK